MKFENISKLASFLAKDYAPDIFRLLLIYPSISASEAASRLDTHIKTAQDFLEGLAEAGIVSREEVYERKRPYNRYTLVKKTVQLELDIGEFAGEGLNDKILNKAIKEKKDTEAVFSTSQRSGILSTVTLFSGKGRSKKERKISLTENQGKFLFSLPFPTQPAETINNLFQRSGISEKFYREIMDIIDLLVAGDVIEMT